MLQAWLVSFTRRMLSRVKDAIASLPRLYPPSDSANCTFDRSVSCPIGCPDNWIPVCVAGRSGPGGFAICETQALYQCGIVEPNSAPMAALSPIGIHSFGGISCG